MLKNCISTMLPNLERTSFADIVASDPAMILVKCVIVYSVPLVFSQNYAGTFLRISHIPVFQFGQYINK